MLDNIDYLFIEYNFTKMLYLITVFVFTDRCLQVIDFYFYSLFVAFK